MNLVILDEREVKRLVGEANKSSWECTVHRNRYENLLEKYKKLKADYEKDVIAVSERNAELEEDLHQTTIMLCDTKDLLATYRDLLERETQYNRDVRH